MMRAAALIVMLTTGCAAAPTPAIEPRVAKQMPRFEPSVAEREKRADSRVGVAGIEGSLSSYDVRVTMEERGEQFGKCHEPRATAVPPLAGQVEFGIHVLVDGTVSRVDIRGSTLGDRELERCLSEVVHETAFPKPNGGEANATYTMLLESLRPQSSPEEWEGGRVKRLVSKRGREVKTACSLSSSGPFDVTAYVNSGGRILAAGVASRAEVSSEELDCIADTLRAWPMPKPKKRYAKVTFALSP